MTEQKLTDWYVFLNHLPEILVHFSDWPTATSSSPVAHTPFVSQPSVVLFFAFPTPSAADVPILSERPNKGKFYILKYIGNQLYN